MKEYFGQKKELYNILVKYIENQDSYNDDFAKLIEIINNSTIKSDKKELEYFLRLLICISDNHHRYNGFFDKIEKIIHNLQENIKQNYSNTDIFHIFSSNKLLLLFLFDKGIVIVDEDINKLIYDMDYPYFFLPEIKPHNSEEFIKQIEDEVKDQNPDIFDNFDEKRRKGENDSYICTLIQNDSIVDFITYVNKNGIALDSKIQPSIYETNQFLIENEPTIIEYSAFYGSIQIFQYLKMNKVLLTPSLWNYSIHSQNSELIQILIERKVLPPFNSYEKVLLKAVKCHHNDIASYIEENFMTSNNYQSRKDDVIATSFNSYNYAFFPDDFLQNSVFFYLCKFKYEEFVKLYLEAKKEEIEKIIIFNLKFFLMMFFIFYLIMFFLFI